MLKEVLDAARRPHETGEEPEARPVPFACHEAESETGAQVRPVLDWAADGRRHDRHPGLKELNLVALDCGCRSAILVVIVGFAVYAISSMPAVRGCSGAEVDGRLARRSSAACSVLAAITWVVVEIREDVPDPKEPLLKGRTMKRRTALIRSALITIPACCWRGVELRAGKCDGP